MSRLLHIAMASTSSLPGEVERNLEQIAGFVRRAATDGADLLLTPELSACGYGSYPDVLATAEVAGEGPISRRALALAAESGVVLGIGFAERNDRLTISHIFAFPDGTFVVQRKNSPTGDEAPFEKPKGAASIQPFTVRGVCCGTLICADAGLRKREALLAGAGVEVVLLPSGAGGKRSARVITRELATKKGRQTYIAALQTLFWPGAQVEECIARGRSQATVNLTGFDGRVHFHGGHGSLTNALGEVVAFFPGQPNLDRQFPTYAHAVIDADARVSSKTRGDKKQ